MKTLKQYLNERRITEDSPDELVQEVKLDYQRHYRREYQAELRRRTKRVELVLSNEDERKLMRGAVEHGMQLATFIRHASLAFLAKEYIVPDADRVRDLELSIRRIGTNVNQIAKQINTESSARGIEIDKVWDLLTELEELITDAFRNPPERP